MENLLKELLPIIVTAINTIGLLYIAFRKGKAEEKKTEVEADNEFIEGAERSAMLSEQLLTKRIDDLKVELEAVKANSKAELQAEREARAKELAAERDARKRETEYLRRRLKESERKAEDYRLWAAKLVKQVVEGGKQPVVFIPSIDESESNIPTITPEQLQQNNEEKK